MKSQQKQELDGIIDKIIGYFRFHDRKERDDETDMWERINREIRQQEKKTRVREYIKRFLIPVSVAACLLLAYVIDKGEFSDNSWTLDAYVGQLADVAEASGQVQLLLSDKRKVQIDKDTVGIVYSSNGKIQIEQEELTDYPFVSLENNTSTRDLHIQYFSSHGLPFRPDLEVTSTDQCLALIQHNLGIGFYPEKLAEEPLKRGEILQIHLKESLPARQICLIQNASRPQSIAAQKLIETLIRI